MKDETAAWLSLPKKTAIFSTPCICAIAIHKFKRDPRGLRYEVVGFTGSGREVAIICRIKSTGKLLLITTYELGDSI